MKIELKLRCPSLPNFIRIDDDKLGQRQDGFKESPSIAIQDLTDEQLIVIADEWREELLKLARKKRVENGQSN